MLFDINIHLPFGGNKLHGLLNEESTMNSKELIHGYNHYQDEFADIMGGNFMIFNENIEHNEIQIFSNYVRGKMKNSFFTLLTNFRFANFEYLEKMKESGVSAIKFHSYVQKISDIDFEDVLECAKNAERLNLPIFIDTSYGTTKMYQHDNLKLAAHLLDHIKSVPVILLHSGGSRVLEAFLLAASCDNVFLDSSFSLHTYLGSAVEQDLAFSYKQIGFDRVVYGSDMPYVSSNESLSSIQTFFINQNINLDQQNAMLLESWKRIFYG